MKQTIQIRSERSVASAVAVAANIATSVGFDKTRVSAVSTAVSEIARNIVKYAEFGQVTIESTQEPDRGIEITARDHGPGIADIDTAMADHFSTGGTLGLGLPGVRRLMDELVIESVPGSGTTVKMRLALSDRNTRPARVAESNPRPTTTMDRLRATRGRRSTMQAPDDHGGDEVAAGSYVRSHRSETVSGDLVIHRWIGQEVLIVLADALGHGLAASKIAARVGEAVAAITEPDVVGTIEAIDEALRGTDGAAVAVVVAHPADRSVDMASVGNVRIRVLGRSGMRLPWAEGTLGQQFRRPVPQHRILGSETLVMYSDGVSDHFSDDDYLEAMVDPPGLTAENIVLRFGKDHDDSSCAVVRFSR